MKRWSWMGGALGLCLLVAAAPAAADSHYANPRPQSSDSIRLRMGLFTPEGGSGYFDSAEEEFTGNASDLEDLVWGGDWVHNFSPYAGVMFSGDYFQGQMDQSYLDFVDIHGHEIRHTTTLEISPLTAGVVFRLAPEELPIHPYAGIGGGLYVWRLEETGDFIDFDFANNVFSDTFVDDGAAFGFYGLVGIDVPISPYFSVFGEARWDKAEDDLGGDFATLGKLDLGGRRIMGGVAWHF